MGLERNQDYQLRISVESKGKWSCIFNENIKMQERTDANWLKWQAVGK